MSAAPPSITLIGAGRMGTAMASGWLSAAPAPALTIIDPHPSEQAARWIADGRAKTGSAPAPADVVIIAVKPQVFPSVAGDIAQWIGQDTLVISVMAAIQLRQLREALGTRQLIRVMPNTPGAIGQGVCLVAPAPETSAEDFELAKTLLQPLGHVEGPMSEADMTAATPLSGCGPAFVFLMAEVLASAAESTGVPADRAARLARETLIGSVALMESSPESPEALRKAVTSPGGITKAGLEVLMADEGGLPSLMRKAMKAVIARDKELSRGD